MKKNKITSKLNIAVLIVLSFLVLFFSLKDNFNGIIKLVLAVNVWWLAVGVLMIFGYCLFRAVVLHSLIKKFNPDYKFTRSFGLTLLTQFYNGVTPFGSGQPFVILTLKKEGFRGTDSTNIVIQDFILHQIALIILGVIAIVLNSMFNIFAKVILLKEIVVIGFIVNLIAVILLFAMAFNKRINKKIIGLAIKFLNKIKIVKDQETVIANWEERIDSFHSGAILLLEDKKEFMHNVGYNVLSLISFYIIPVAVLYSMGNFHYFNAFHAIIASAYIMLVGVIIPTPGSTGGLEFAFMAFFGNFVGGSFLSAMMLLWRFITYYLFIIVGAIVFYIWNRKD